ncbi:unnamed protein product [Rhizophagus irregularis]|nr:unnamed protein product [Rhizophagus irregularis]
MASLKNAESVNFTKHYLLRFINNKLLCEIKQMLGNMGSILADSLSKHYYHKEQYLMRHPRSYFGTQLEIVGEENSRRVYYTIEALEELLCITEGKLYKCGHWLRPEPGAIRCRLVIRQIPLLGRISCTSKNLLNVDSALKEGSEDEKELHKNVKRVTEVIVVLLMDRVDVDKKPVMKKQLVQGITMGNQESSSNTEIPFDMGNLTSVEDIEDINMEDLTRDLYKVYLRCNRVLKVIALNILKYLPEEIFQECYPRLWVI